MTEINAEKALVTFYPQIWRDNRAVTSDETEQFFVPIEDATDEDGELLEDDTDQSDRLREHRNAPERTQNWAGPFYVTVEPVATIGELDPDVYDIKALCKTIKPEYEQEVPPPNGDGASTEALSAGQYTIQYTPESGDSTYSLSLEVDYEGRTTVEIPIDEATARDILQALPGGGWSEDTILDMPIREAEWRGVDLSEFVRE